MADKPAFLEPLVEVVGKANHDYFFRRDQTRIAWSDLPPIYRHTARECHLEILLDGPVQLVEHEIDKAREEASILRMRLGMYLADLRGRAPHVRAVLEIADEIDAILNQPMEG